jgi:glycosyltransferase involved in cell wall biosynthesis
MIIGIDVNEANVDRKVGISEYVFQLMRQFSHLASKDIDWQVYLKNNPSKDFPEMSEKWEYKVFGPKKFWTQFALPLKLALTNKKPDVFFSPGHYSPRFSRIPRVISIMDLAFHHFPEYFTTKDLAQLKSWTKYSILKADGIITISQATKDDILKLYGVKSEKVHVVYPGIKETLSLEPHIYPMKELENKFGITKKYLLFVGTLQPRKNIRRLIEAFSKVHIIDSDLQLVIVGRKGWKYEEILSAPEEYGVKDSVAFLDFVKDEDLQMLYKGAQCFVWPSLYEGFGLPVLEAMQYGCPVITSNISSLPEAGGDAAIYVDPENVDDIAEKIKKVLGDKELRESMIKKGYLQVKKFSWEKAAKETLAVLKEVVGRS